MKKLLNILMLSCKKAGELIEKKLSGKLSAAEEVQLTMHTKMCKSCSNYQSQQGIIDQALKEDCTSSSNEAECEDLKLSILKQLQAEEGK